MTIASTQDDESVPPKKLYETPRLEVYGDVREIARVSGTMTMFDSGLHVFRTK
jgi:hypothetical protein